MLLCRCRYELLRLSTHLLPGVCHAITVLQHGGCGISPAQTAAAPTCQLLAACHSGLQVYSLRVSARQGGDAFQQQATYTVHFEPLYKVPRLLRFCPCMIPPDSSRQLGLLCAAGN